MSLKVFIDTNVLVYVYDDRAPAKKQQAQAFLAEQLHSKQVVISSQVVQEFMHVALKKLPASMATELPKVITDVLEPLWAHTPSVDFYVRALELHRSHSLSFYDALIVQAALDLGCSTLYSEDLQAGQTFGSLRIVNPFA